MKYIGPLNYFLGIQVHDIVGGLSFPNINMLEILAKASVIACKPIDTPPA
jgi:hypothetical protein